MVPECQRADAHPPGSAPGPTVGLAVVSSTGCCAYGSFADPRAGWDMVQCDWGLRQREEVAPRSCPVMRLLALPIAALHALLRGRVRC